MIAKCARQVQPALDTAVVFFCLSGKKYLKKLTSQEAARLGDSLQLDIILGLVILAQLHCLAGA